MNRKFSRHERGFTLLEVVFAVGILAIGLMGYTALKVSSKNSWFFSKNLTQAVQLTIGQLEYLLAVGYNNTRLDATADTTGKGAGVYYYTASAYQIAYGSALTEGGTATSATSAVDKILASSFAPSSVQWVVREHCPSELTKMVNYTTTWNNGANTMNISQVQVRP